MLKSFIRYFKEELDGLLKQMKEESLFLYDLKGKDFYVNERIGSPIKDKNSQAFLKKIKQGYLVTYADLLSSREKETLKLLTVGHTAKGVALALTLFSYALLNGVIERQKSRLIPEEEMDQTIQFF